MNPILRNIIAVTVGFIIGSVVNMSIISISGYIIPPPEGADVNTAEGLKAAIQLFQPRHFLFPYLAHALGTFTGALVTAGIAANHKLEFALFIGILFLAGGIYMVKILPSPLWFNVVDLVGAYIPIAYLGGKLIMKKERK